MLNHFLSQIQKMQEQVSIQGKNFQGSIKHSADILQFKLTEFKKGDIYSAKISQASLLENQKQFFPFTKIIDLFLEIISNQNLRIADQKLLLIPISMIYKEKRIRLTVKLRLTKSNDSDETMRFQNLVDLVEVLANQKKELQKLTPKLIHFRGDQTNVNFDKYQFNTSQRRLKKISTTKDIYAYNHYESLPKTGVFHFKFKVIKLKYRYMCFGLCTKSICDKQKIEKQQPDCIGVNLNNGDIEVYKCGKRVPPNAYDDHTTFRTNKDYADETDVKDEESISGSLHYQPEFRLNFDSDSDESQDEKEIYVEDVFKVEIDMNKNHISWYQNSTIIATQLIKEEIKSQRLCPFVILDNQGDEIEFLCK